MENYGVDIVKSNYTKELSYILEIITHIEYLYYSGSLREYAVKQYFWSLSSVSNSTIYLSIVNFFVELHSFKLS